MDNSRKASDILLNLENKIDQLTSMLHAQALDIRVISNKLNKLMEQTKEAPPAPPPVTSYSASTETGKMHPVLLQSRAVPVRASDTLPMQDTPQGVRRNSRPETSGNARQTQVAPQSRISIQDPSPPNMSQFIKAQTPPAPPPQVEPEEPQFKAFENLPPQAEATNKVAVTQRITEKNGKSVFLAEVEVFDEDGNQIFKTRTNGVGKWQAALPVGNYRVRIGKRESVTKQKVEKTQNITVDGRTSQLILEQIIIDK